MAIAIRLARQGSKRRPFYRIVAAEKKQKRDGRFIDQVGVYDPRVDRFEIDVQKYDEWLKKGARPSQTVHSLVRKSKRAAVS